MVDFLEVAKTGSMADGTMKKISVRGHDILLAKAGGKFYATEARCPHMGGDLSKGTLNGTVIECPLHHSRFELAGGSVVRWLGGSGLVSGVLGKLKGPVPLRTYEVRIDGDSVLVNAP
jgi:3-phenylpropionate/trans-cinnamate dioxygenase ferredoxin subunit